MAKSNAAKIVTIGKSFSNSLQYIDMVYNIANDSLTFDDTIVIGVLNDDMIIHESLVWVEDAVESLGAATMKIGDTDTVDSFLTDTGKATLVDNYIGSETTGQGKFLAAGKEIIVAPLIASLTAGIVHLKLTVSNASL